MDIVELWPADAGPDEVAALATAITLYLESEVERAEIHDSRWRQAGRLEALRIPPTPARIRRGWRV